jgi:hypothetical protein
VAAFSLCCLSRGWRRRCPAASPSGRHVYVGSIARGRHSEPALEPAVIGINVVTGQTFVLTLPDDFTGYVEIIAVRVGE